MAEALVRRWWAEALIDHHSTTSLTRDFSARDNTRAAGSASN